MSPLNTIQRLGLFVSFCIVLFVLFCFVSVFGFGFGFFVSLWTLFSINCEAPKREYGTMLVCSRILRNRAKSSMRLSSSVDKCAKVQLFAYPSISLSRNLNVFFPPSQGSWQLSHFSPIFFSLKDPQLTQQ
ncbi:hypothetical protein METBIDRAFT_103598 [Metschnikowia bicuspidata var. bicuspidata NRRL YB-4993]|uniref:Uncharacterized protein n=1 Tax=Metschnikowia bicuspidata var. bicuspidata NRRL YB-4993 TaxID=869754 RepID=A0A1A0HH06_9ASCO|nr:hypothetical protein METBIDRAFT_103598 [Metschnikowia bicuspidata var. bicuspidata NRRL YB-4993]OBA23275.1 hypothetical protein METBIDRAFT_103598 [Metschnikowia bicuspidata var. bicuspidata NRRL YB-4993]